jgi:hypothetical protein
VEMNLLIHLKKSKVKDRYYE